MKKMRYLALAICSLLLTSCSNSIPYEEMDNFYGFKCVNLNEWDTHVLTVNSSYDLSEGTFDYNNKVYSFDSDEIDYIHYTVYAGVLRTRDNDNTLLPTREEILDYTEEQRKEHKFTYDGSIDVKSVTGGYLIVNGSDVYVEFGYLLDGPIINFLLAGEYHIIADVAFNDEQYINVDLGYYYVYDPETITYINTIDDFMDINTYGGYYYLNADLDFEGIDFKTIFHYHSDRKYNRFLLINPDNHVIKNITINEGEGIFLDLYSGLVDGLIIDNLNINVSDDNDSRESRVGGLFSYIADSAILKNCHIIGNINPTNINYVGGLVGTTYMDEISDINYPNYHLINCSFHGNINHTFSDSETDLSRTNIATGGLIGIVDITYTDVYISDSRYKMKGELINYPKSSVSAQIEGPQYVGGLSGIVYIGDISNYFGEKYFDYNFDGFNFNGELKSTSGYKTDNIVGKVYSYSGLINDL